MNRPKDIPGQPLRRVHHFFRNLTLSTKRQRSFIFVAILFFSGLVYLALLWPYFSPLPAVGKPSPINYNAPSVTFLEEQTLFERVLPGQILVRKGELLTYGKLELLKSFGYGDPLRGLMLLAGFLLILSLLLFLFVQFLRHFEKRTYKNLKLTTMMAFLWGIIFILAAAFAPFSIYLVPLSAIAILLTIFINGRVAVLATLLMAMVLGLIYPESMQGTLLLVAGSIAAIYSSTRAKVRTDLAKTGLLVAVVHIVAVIALGLIGNIPISTLWDRMLWSSINGLGSAMIAMGALPYLENLFNISTPFRLQELANPTHPLLRKLLMEAPGTYHHSILVGNLAERAAEAIGADPLIARVGAYFHDIGKVKRPYFFAENQMNQENPHDHISPQLSTLVVTSHTKEGLELAEEYNLPHVIRKFIIQHHGDSLVTYFYHQARMKEKGDEPVSESQFRYVGQRPNSKETAILMIADAAEAAVRALEKPTPARIEGTVANIIQSRLKDNQFSDAPITLRDLTLIHDTFVKMLSSLYHSRVSYPGEKGDRKDEPLQKEGIEGYASLS